MALFGGQRDASLIRHLNKELINKIMDISVAYYKLAISNINVNAYGETDDNGLVFYEPLLIPCIITYDEQSYNEEEHGQDLTQTITFAFLRDTLVEFNLVPEVGDIVEYNNEYWEIDSKVIKQFWAGKNPDTSYAGEEFGYNVSIRVSGHLTRKSRISGLVKWDYQNI
jgi:hypothetical protein